MNISLLNISLLTAAVLQLCSLNSPAFTISLQEQGSLTGSIVGGGGSVIINPIASDHWSVTVQDMRIGNPTNPPSNLAFIEPETVSGLTAYNNLQVLSLTPGNSVNPGTLTFDVLSDEFSPYMVIVGNGGTALFQGTDRGNILLMFNDIADTVPEPGTLSLMLAGGVLILFKHRRP